MVSLGGSLGVMAVSSRLKKKNRSCTIVLLREVIHKGVENCIFDYFSKTMVSGLAPSLLRVIFMSLTKLFGPQR